MEKIQRCFGNKENEGYYAKYHDEEWGVPIYEDQKLFEVLSLEGAQAGLSFALILKKREGYRKYFHNFNIDKCAKMTDEYLLSLLDKDEIIRHKLKIFSVRKNAIIVKEIQKKYKSFSNYVWSQTGNKIIYHHFKDYSELISENEISLKMSKELKKMGMSFVGSKIIYAFLQASGVINDHMKFCHKYNKIKS